MLSTKKMKNSWSWGKFSRFLAQWSREFSVLLLFCGFMVLLSALCYSNWFLDCVLYIALSLPSIEVEFIPSIWNKIAMSTVAVSGHFFFSIFSFFFIYSSAFLGSFLWCFPFFPAFHLFFVNSSLLIQSCFIKFSLV